MNTPDLDRLRKLAGILPLYEDVNPYEDADIYTRITEIVNEWEEEEGHEPGTGPIEVSKMRGSDTVEVHTKNFDEIPGELYDMLLDDRGLRIHEEWHNSMAVTYQITSRDKPRRFEDINPYEDSDEYWWWDDESNDGVSWWNVEDLLKKVSEKVVGPDYGVYAKIWYNILSHYADEIWNNTDEEDFDEVEMMDNVRQNVVANVSEEDWNQFIETEMKYYIPEYQILSDNPDALENFRKIGELLHKALESKEKPSLNEDVNPYADADLSDYDEFLESYIKVCAKYFPAFSNDPELADQLKDKTLGDFVFEYLKQDATLSQRDEPKELFDTFSEEDIMKRIKLLANEA